jgi:hypothetical protein
MTVRIKPWRSVKAGASDGPARHATRGHVGAGTQGWTSLPCSGGAMVSRTRLDNRLIVPFRLRDRSAPIATAAVSFETREVNCRDGSDSRYPPCGPGRLLRLARAAARPVTAWQADRRWWRGCACRFLRSQGLWGPRRNAGTACTRALSAAHLCQRPFQGLPTAGRRRHLGVG